MLLKKIVIAEDDDAIAHMVNMALGDAGFLCLRARDGEEALKLVKAHDPDLLVLDVMMPRVDGLEVARTLKADVMWSRTPILMLTALAAVEDQVHGIEAGADAYMAKPFDLREFGARVKALIRAARRERDRNPTTNLPGSRAIDEEIEGALKSGKPTSVVHIDVLNFDGYADAIGIARSENIVREVGVLLLAAGREASGGGAFVGHIGGSDFITVLSPDHITAFVSAAERDFDAKRQTLPGEPKELALVIAIAPTDGLTLNGGADELGRRLGRAMKQAKAAGKTGHVTWSAWSVATREPDDTDPAVADTTAAPEEPRPRGPKLRAVHAGDTLGRYELEDEIGEGGMATVYRARDRELRREVAIKVLFGHLAKRPEIVQRFHREARAAANLEHPNILRIYDVGGASEDGDPSYIVMELIKGRTLLQEIEQRGPVLAEIAACIGALLADALAAAHAKGIIHRDIKPANVLIAHGGRLLLADFGVARLETEDSLVTKTGALLGTPAYMSPEQASGDTATAKSDLYSLGATLYQLATGSLPYTGSPAKIMASIATGGMVSAVRRRPAVGPDVSRAIDRLMKVDPEERPASALEAAADLRALVASGGLGDATDELAGFFADPEQYLATRTPTVVSALVAEAEKAATTGRLPRAMALADRASALAPDDPAVKTLVERVTTRSSKAPRIALVGVALVALAGGGVFVATRHGEASGSGSGSGSIEPRVVIAIADANLSSEPEPEPEPEPDAGVADAPVVDAPRARVVSRDAAVAMSVLPDAAPIVVVDAPPPPPVVVDAPPEPGAIIVDNDIWCDIAIDGVARGRERNKPLAVPAGPHIVSCTNGAKHWEEAIVVAPGKTTKLAHQMLQIVIRFDVEAAFDGVAHHAGETLTVTPGGHRLGDRFLEFSAPCVVRRTPDLDCVR